MEEEKVNCRETGTSSLSHLVPSKNIHPSERVLFRLNYADRRSFSTISSVVVVVVQYSNNANNTEAIVGLHISIAFSTVNGTNFYDR